MSEKGVFGHFWVFSLFKIDFSAHFGPETLLRSQIGALFEKVIFEVLGFWGPRLGPSQAFVKKKILLGAKKVVVTYMFSRPIFDAESNFEVKSDFRDP